MGEDDILYNLLLERLKKDIIPYIDEIVTAKTVARTKYVLEALYDLPLNVDQVAILLGEDVKTVYKWRERDVLTFHKSHGRIHTTLRDIMIDLMGKDPLK